MHIEAFSPEDPHGHFPPGSTFHPESNAVATALTFVNVLYTQSESKLPILTENNNNHQIISPKGRIGFSSLDISNNIEPKYKKRDRYELRNAIFPTNEQHNNCFLLHLKIPSQSRDEFCK